MSILQLDKLRPYEGEKVADGEYKLGQLHKPRHGRVVKWKNDKDYELYNEMIVAMDQKTFNDLFDYVTSRDGSIHEFTAVVKDQKIVHVF